METVKMQPKERKNVWLLIAGMGVSRIGTLAFSFAVGLYILNQTGSSMSFALSMILSAVPRILVSPMSGIFADRYSKKTIVVLGDILSGLVVLALLLQGDVSVWSLYVVITLLSILNTFFSTAITASLPNLVYDSQLMKLNSSFEVFRSLASIFGPMMGGLLFGFGNLKWIIIINGVSFILSGLSELFIDFKLNSKVQKEEESEKKSFKEVWTFLKVEKFFIVMLTMSLSYNFLITVGINVPHTYLLNNVLYLSPKYIGIVEALISVGMITGAILISAIPKNKLYLSLYLSSVLLGISILLAGLPYLFTLSFGTLFNVIYQGMVLFVAGFTLAVINIPIGTKMQQMVPERLRGRVFSLFGMIGSALVPFGLLLSGGLIQIVAPQWIIVVSGVVIALISVSFMSFKEMRNLFVETLEEKEAAKAS
ncbi:MAG: MFS transporter [Clostridia bacterium]|nr:MFS transporter [Clostridia bacterium]